MPVRSCCARARATLVARRNVVEAVDVERELADEDLEEVPSEVEEACPLSRRSASNWLTSASLTAPGGGSSRMKDPVGSYLYDQVQPYHR